MFLLTEFDIKELNAFVCSTEKKILSPEESEKSLQQNLVTLVYDNGRPYDVGSGVRITKDIVLTAHHNIAPVEKEWEKVYRQKQETPGFLSVVDYAGAKYELDASFLFHSAEEQDLALVKGKGFSEIKPFNSDQDIVPGKEVYIVARPSRDELYKSELGLVVEQNDIITGEASYNYISKIKSFPGCSGGALVCNGALAGIIRSSNSITGPDGRIMNAVSAIGMSDIISFIKETMSH